MRILAIDGDPRALDLLTACLRQACPQGAPPLFQRAQGPGLVKRPPGPALMRPFWKWPCRR